MIDYYRNIADVSLGLNDEFSVRFDRLRLGEMRIAYYYDYPDESTFRYRVFNMIEVIEDLNREIGRGASVSASWFCFRDGDKLDHVIEKLRRYNFLTRKVFGVSC